MEPAASNTIVLDETNGKDGVIHLQLAHEKCGFKCQKEGQWDALKRLVKAMNELPTTAKKQMNNSKIIANN